MKTATEIEAWLTTQAVTARLNGHTYLSIRERTGVGFFAEVAEWNLASDQLRTRKRRRVKAEKHWTYRYVETDLPKVAARLSKHGRLLETRVERSF